MTFFRQAICAFTSTFKRWFILKASNELKKWLGQNETLALWVFATVARGFYSCCKLCVHRSSWKICGWMRTSDANTHLVQTGTAKIYVCLQASFLSLSFLGSNANVRIRNLHHHPHDTWNLRNYDKTPKCEGCFLIPLFTFVHVMYLRCILKSVWKAKFYNWISTWWPLSWNNLWGDTLVGDVQRPFHWFARLVMNLVEVLSRCSVLLCLLSFLRAYSRSVANLRFIPQIVIVFVILYIVSIWSSSFCFLYVPLLLWVFFIFIFFSY